MWGNPVSPPPSPRESLGGRSLHAGGWGNPVSPPPSPRESLGGRSPPRNNLPRLYATTGATWAAISWPKRRALAGPSAVMMLPSTTTPGPR